MLNDEFRRLMLAQSDLSPSILRYQAAMRLSLERAAAEVAPYLDVKLISRLSGRHSS